MSKINNDNNSVILNEDQLREWYQLAKDISIIGSLSMEPRDISGIKKYQEKPGKASSEKDALMLLGENLIDVPDLAEYIKLLARNKNNSHLFSYKNEKGETLLDISQKNKGKEAKKISEAIEEVAHILEADKFNKLSSRQVITKKQSSETRKRSYNQLFEVSLEEEKAAKTRQQERINQENRDRELRESVPSPMPSRWQKNPISPEAIQTPKAKDYEKKSKMISKISHAKNKIEYGLVAAKTSFVNKLKEVGKKRKNERTGR